MEWRKCYLDLILVPLAFVVNIGYHLWLWHRVKTQPMRTDMGMQAAGRRLWVIAMMKVRNLSYILFQLGYIFFLFYSHNDEMRSYN